MASSEYEAYVRRGRASYGDRFDERTLYPQFRQWYHGGVRVELDHPERRLAGSRRTGTIGATTGWQPAFLLVYSSRAMGSSDLLRADDHVIAYQDRYTKQWRPFHGGGVGQARTRSHTHPTHPYSHPISTKHRRR